MQKIKESFGFEVSLMDINSYTDFSELGLKKLFNTVEDACHIYDNKKAEISEETKEIIENYLVNAINWTKKNKAQFSGFNHRYLEIFDNIQTDLNRIDDLVAEIITPIKEQTIHNWLNYFKSSDAFYAIQGNHRIIQDIESKGENGLEISEVYDRNIYKNHIKNPKYSNSFSSKKDVSSKSNMHHKVLEMCDLYNLVGDYNKKIYYKEVELGMSNFLNEKKPKI